MQLRVWRTDLQDSSVWQYVDVTAQAVKPLPREHPVPEYETMGNFRPLPVFVRIKLQRHSGGQDEAMDAIH